MFLLVGVYFDILLKNFICTFSNEKDFNKNNNNNNNYYYYQN